MKIKALSKKIESIFRLSEDYDSDESDIEDDVKYLLNRKKIKSKLKKTSNSHLELEGKLVKYVKWLIDLYSLYFHQAHL